MLDFLKNLFETDFMPHGHCFFWKPAILWMHVGSDVVIALSYFTIPLALITFVRKRKDLSFSTIFVLFAAFILACGATHLIAMITIWSPAYRLEGVVKLMTALISISTAVVLWRLLPDALQLPSPSQLEAEIDRRKETEEELRQLNDDLEARVAARTAELERSVRDWEMFAHAASHDLQAPIRRVRTLLDAVEDRESIDDDTRRFISLAVKSAADMQEIVKALLEFARVGSVAPANDIDLADSTRRVWETNGSEQVALDVELGKARVNFAHFERVMSNLLSNAVKYGATKVSVSESVQDGTRVVTVRDDGVGIPKDKHDEAFQIFRRLHTDSEVEGTGIGLALCRRIVQSWGGAIWIEPEEPPGAAVSFTLPEQDAS